MEMTAEAPAAASENLDLMLRVRIDEERVEGLRALAGECGSSMSAIVRLAVDRELSRERWSLCACGVWLTEAEVTWGDGSDVCLCDGQGGVIRTAALPDEGTEPAPQGQASVSASDAATPAAA